MGDGRRHLRRHARARPRRETLSGQVQGRMMARSLGALFVLAGATATASLAFPDAKYALADVALVVACVALGVGGLLLTGILDDAPPSTFKLVLALGTMLAAAGVYEGGSPSSGAQFFFLWLIPYAYAFFSTRQAMLQTSLMAASYALVLAVQLHQHPGLGPSGELVGMWIIAVATVVIVGTLARRLSRSLRDVDRRFHQGFVDSPIGAAFVSQDLVWVEVNDALASLLGRDPAELIGKSVLEVTHPSDLGLSQSLQATLGDNPVEFEKRYLRPDGTVVWAAVSTRVITPEVGQPYRFSQFRDITEHKRDRETLEHQAAHDPLTSLFNRTLLLDRLETALERRQFSGKQVAVVLLDLDQFKVVNDSLGHHVGDEVLSAIAPRLAAVTRSGDTLSRFGGDEFVLLCDRLRDPMDAVDRASELATALSAPVALSSGLYSVSASVGVAVSTGSADTASTLLRDADAAMYRAKAAGRGRVELFDNSMRDQAIERLQLENDLRGAVAGRQLVLEYQPVVNAATGRPVAVEALIRWNHPTRGRLGPDMFIPLAEETGLIVDLGNWVLEEALTQLATWQAAVPMDPPLSISVNVSGRQLAVTGLAERVARLLRELPLAPRSVGVELTESVLLDEGYPASTLQALRNLGVHILLDDFGTGYSSLGYLERFPIDALKIDRSFVMRLEEGDERSAVLQAIFTMASALGLEAIAEGVETPGQLRQLRDLGCRWIQGYVICRPLPAEKVLDFIAEQATLSSALGGSSAG
ncbi:MAG TPA: EAL domain-containing protein [Acidimicrobiales bacterium]|nr:EAL domain-containing protein [Acidimicrobiales bacterium]